MKNSIGAFADSAKKNHVVHHEPAGTTIAYVETLDRILAYCRALLLLAVFASLSFTASTVRAQDFGGFQGLAPASTRFTGSLSAPETHELAGALHLVISMAEPDHFRISEAPQHSTAQPNGYQPYERMGDSIVYSGRFALAREVLETTYGSPINSRPLNPESIFSGVETKYMRWESSLADSRSLTNVNGATLYPLAQIDYAGWHLPITLNTAPVPGGETRW